MSRINAVRSSTLTLSLRIALSISRCWAGDNSSSKMMTLAPVSARSATSSSTLPEPIRVAGFGRSNRCSRAPITFSPAVSASNANSANESAIGQSTVFPFSSIPTSSAVSCGTCVSCKCDLMKNLPVFQPFQPLHRRHEAIRCLSERDAQITFTMSSKRGPWGHAHAGSH